jgi:hypothetical protein
MSSIQAYTSATSVLPGEQIDFLVSYDHETSSSHFTIDFYRIGAPEIHLNQQNGSADAYPIPVDYNYSGCQWPPGYSLQVPDDWTSGVYRARLTGSSGDTTDVLFVVKAAAPGTSSKVLVASAVNTYQAYNGWGGGSLYSTPRSVTVTFDRPGDQVGFLNMAEHSFISWAESNNIALEYCTSIDLHANSEIMNNYELLVSVGHDEYWSKEMRDGVEAFVANGGNVAFFSGNVCWWQVRFENNNRRMVCYKSDEDPATPDPLLQTSRATIHWFNSPVNRPENQMTGVSFRNGAGWWDAWPAGQPYPNYVVRDCQHWVFNGTGLQNGDIFGSGAEILWYETDAAAFVEQNGVPQVTGRDFTPTSFHILATADLRNWKNQQGWATMGIYQNNGGNVFAAATIGWARGLQANDQIVSQITNNVITRLSRPAIGNRALGWVSLLLDG